MARVTGLRRSSVQGGQSHPTEVVCEWRVFGEAESILQLDTRGSLDREIPEKLSQTLQFDRKGARELLQVILGAFPGLDRDRSDSA